MNPIIVVNQDDGNIYLYKNFKQLNNGSIEPEDVGSNLYLAYDTQGNLYKLSANYHKEQRKFLFFFKYTHVYGTREIFIKQISYNCEYSDELKKQLLFFFKCYHQMIFQSDTPLHHLIEKFLTFNNK